MLFITDILIAYYSRRGGNYVNGAVRALAVGNTQLAAKAVQRLTGGDLFFIEPGEPYPEDYYVCIDRARQDLLNGVRPKLSTWPEDFGRYHTVYLGYPNYWGTMPVAVFSFLEGLDFTGKLMKPFCTYEDTGMGRSERDLRRVCPTAHIAPGFPIHGGDVEYELSALKGWIEEPMKATKPTKPNWR